MRRGLVAAFAACSLTTGCGAPTTSLDGDRNSQVTTQAVHSAAASLATMDRARIEPLPTPVAEPIAGDWTHWRVREADDGWTLRDVGRPKPPDVVQLENRSAIVVQSPNTGASTVAYVAVPGDEVTQSAEELIAAVETGAFGTGPPHWAWNIGGVTVRILAADEQTGRLLVQHLTLIDDRLELDAAAGLDVLYDGSTGLADLAFSPERGRYHADEFTRYVRAGDASEWLSLSIARNAAGGVHLLRAIAEAGTYPASGPYLVEPMTIATNDGLLLSQQGTQWPTHVALWPVGDDLVVLSGYMIEAVEFRRIVDRIEPVARTEWQTMLDSAQPATEELRILGEPTWSTEVSLTGVDIPLLVSELDGGSFCLGIVGDTEAVRCTSRKLENDVWLTNRIVLATNPYQFGPLVVDGGVGYVARDVTTPRGETLVVIHFDEDRPQFGFPDLAANG